MSLSRFISYQIFEYSFWLFTNRKNSKKKNTRKYIIFAVFLVGVIQFVSALSVLQIYIIPISWLISSGFSQTIALIPKLSNLIFQSENEVLNIEIENILGDIIILSKISIHKYKQPTKLVYCSNYSISLQRLECCFSHPSWFILIWLLWISRSYIHALLFCNFNSPSGLTWSFYKVEVNTDEHYTDINYFWIHYCNNWNRLNLIIENALSSVKFPDVGKKPVWSQK